VLIGLAQDPNDLLIAVSRLLHLPLTIEEAIISSYLGSKKPGQVSLALQPGGTFQAPARYEARTHHRRRRRTDCRLPNPAGAAPFLGTGATHYRHHRHSLSAA